MATKEQIESDRNATIKDIKQNLQRRSGKAWSVTGGRGTAYGWITIQSPPARQTAHSVLKAGATNNWPESYETVDTGEPNGYMTQADREELAKLLGLDKPVHFQGESIPASSDYRKEYLQRARGQTPTVKGEPYWD